MYKNKENNFTGLTEEEVRRSREEHGSNKLPDPELKKWWEFALDALKEPITVILIVITIVTLILSILGVEHISGPILTLIVIGLVTGIAVKTNTAIQKSTENLRRKTAIRYCEVIRDGEVKTINADDLVVGDITMVTLGQEIHADGYLIDGKISVSNAVINGEAEECKKTVIQDYIYEKDESTDAYKNQNHLFAGTVVVAGEGLEKVTVVGKDTVNGETLINMQTLEAPKTALDIALGKLANFINKWGTIAAIIAFVTMTVSGIMQAGLAQYFSGNVLEIINKIAANVSNAATIIVAAVPEQYFTFIAVKVIDVEVEKVMLELRLTLAKEDKINNKIKGKDKLVSVCKQLSEPLAKKAEELCKTKFYKNSHFEVGSRIAFIDELQIYNSNFINYLVFVLDNLNIILRENLGINLRIAALAKEDTHCPFDKNINNVLNEAGFTATHIKDFLIKMYEAK